MFNFSQYVKIYYNQGYNLDLNEELDSTQKSEVDKWGGNARAKAISSHVIPHDQDRISIPFKGGDTPSKPNIAVQLHLEKHGYKIHDYREGTATKVGDKRIFKIGKVLNSTNAEKSVHNHFQNDPARSAAKSGAKGMHIVISRHPHDVAAMSTGQGWSSCMEMGRGSNEHYLEQDVKHGTHVAYLAHHDDPTAKKPIARIALKPFEPEDKSKKTILRPEPEVYGTPHQGFKEAVSKWSNGNFPAEETHYTKNEKLYHDGGAKHIIHKDLAKVSTDPKIRKHAYSPDQDLTKEEIDHGMKDENETVRATAVAHPNATTEHISRALNDEHQKVRSAAASHPNATEDQISKAMNDKHASVPVAAVKNPNATNEHLTKAMDSGKKPAQLAVLDHPKATSEHVSKAIDSKHEDVRSAIFNVNYGQQQANGYTPTTYKHKIAPDVLEKALNDKVFRVRYEAIAHPGVTGAQAERALDDPDNYVRHIAASNPKLSSEALHKALNSEDDNVRNRAGGNASITKEHVDEAVKKEDLHTLSGIIKNPAAKNMLTKDQVNRIFNVAIHPGAPAGLHPVMANHHQMNKIWTINALYHQHHDKLTDNHHEAVVNHPDADFRNTVANKHMPREILQKLAKKHVPDPNSFRSTNYAQQALDGHGLGNYSQQALNEK